MLRPTTWFHRLPPAAPLLAGVGLLVLVAVLSATGESAVEIGQGWIPRFDRRTAVTEELPEPLRRDEYETPPVLRIVAAFGLVVLLLVMAAMMLIGLVAIIFGMHIDRFRRRPKLQPFAPVQEEVDGGAAIRVDLMRRAAGGALERLLAASGGDPGDAVVAAWLMLEESAAECGLARQRHQTPTEFTAAVLAGLHVDGDALDRLRLAYQRARFSRHPVTIDDVRAATEALRRVITDLDGTAAAGAATAASAASGAGNAAAGTRSPA